MEDDPSGGGGRCFDLFEKEMVKAPLRASCIILIFKYHHHHHHLVG